MVAAWLVMAMRSPGRLRRSAAIKSTSRPLEKVRCFASSSMFAFDGIGTYYTAARSASGPRRKFKRRPGIESEQQRQ